MAKRLAIDWDDSELRLVAVQGSGNSVKVTDAAVIPVEEGKVAETLKAAISRRGLEKLETFVAIGRGTAELRELKLPAVPDNELPDMVRFQAIRSFASAGDSAAVDFLVTRRADDGIEMIAAAIGPAKLSTVSKTCEQAGLSVRRIALRPLTAAGLYLSRHPEQTGETVLIDLLADDAEIVIARDAHVVFVRTVRLPSDPAARPAALAGELKRSLVACGSSGGGGRRVLLWGRTAVHREDVAMIGEATGDEVTTLDPFDLVDVDPGIAGELPDHVGRLAPLVGLLVCDEAAPERLIDFLNPRKRVEESTNYAKIAAMVGIPIAAAALIGWFGYRQLAEGTREIEALTAENANLKPLVDAANASVDRTEKVDQFLDGDVNWLDEMTRIARVIPPADELIVNSFDASSSGRTGTLRGGGEATITLEGVATSSRVIDRLSESLRDEHHRVTLEGAKTQESEDAYRWTFSELIAIDPQRIREARYEAIAEQLAAEASDAEPAEGPGGDEPETEPEVPRQDAPANDDPNEQQGPDEEPTAGENLLETSAPSPRGDLAADRQPEVSR